MEIKRQQQSLGQILEASGAITHEQLETGLEEQRRTGEPLGRILVRFGWVREQDVVRALKGLLVVTFELGGEPFAAETLFVREIIKAQPPLPVPEVPNYISGIISLRDKVIPVMDLRLRFGLPAPALDEATRVMVCEVPGRVAGLLVDSVGAVLQLPGEAITACPDPVRGIPARYIYGMGQHQGAFYTILNLEPLVQSREAITLKPGGQP